MGLVVRPVEIDLTHTVIFKEPQLDASKEDNRLKIIHYIVKAFEIKINDLKANIETPSNNLWHFSRFYDRSFFDASIGLEEYTARLRNPNDKELVYTLYKRLAELFKSVPISSQTVMIQQQLATDGDATSHLKSLNPSCPAKFKDILEQSGVHYTLKIPSPELTIDITLVGSLFVPEGLYLSETMSFHQDLSDIKKTFDLIYEYHDFIFEELGLSMEDNQ